MQIADPEWIAQPGGGIFFVAGFDAVQLSDGTVGPSLSLPVALPPTGSFSVEVSLAGVRPLGRHEQELFRDDGHHGRDARWRPADAWGFVEVGGPQWGGDVRMLPLRVRAVRPDAEGQLFTTTQLEIALTFTPDAGQQGEQRGAAVAGPGVGGARRNVRGMADLAARAVVNPDQVDVRRRVAPLRLPTTRRDEGFDTATSPWLRIGVRERGIYVIDGDALIEAGIDPASVDLDQLRLFAGPPGALPESLSWSESPSWMEPCALYLEDDGDGPWDDQTRLYFLGNGPDGWFDDLDLAAPSEDDRYFTHPYADTFHYWLCWGGDFSGAPLWMEERDAQPIGDPPLEVADARAHVEPNAFLDTRPRQQGFAWPLFYALSVSASETDLGASLTAELGREPADLPARVHVALWGRSWSSATPDHRAAILVNGDTLGVETWNDLDRVVVSADDVELNHSNVVALKVPQRYTQGGDPLTDQVYLDWVDIEYSQPLVAEADSLEFFLTAEASAGRTIRVTGLDAPDGWLLLDAGSMRRPVVLQPSISAVGGAYAAEFPLEPQEAQTHLVLLRRDRAARPHSVTQVSPEGGWLRGRSDPVDYVIVTVPELRAPAEALSAHRRSNFYGAAGDTATTAEVALVMVQAIFDEFSWGQHDPGALRNFLAFARDTWRDDPENARLSHVLFLGNAHQDPRDYLKAGVPDQVPSGHIYGWQYQSSSKWEPAFYGDDWLVLFDGPQDLADDLFPGRLAVVTEAQAWNVVRKIIQYETAAPLGEWRTRLLFSADDVCQGTKVDQLGFYHMRYTERLCEEAAPADARLEKIYLYEYGAECRYDRKPEATQDLMDAIEAGALVFNYVGHGSDVQLADERLLDQSSVASLQNEDRPFLMITASCAVGRFTSDEEGLAVQALRLAEGGALGVVSASATAGSEENFRLNRFLIQELFSGATLSGRRALGPALVAAKWSNLDDNDLRYNLLGDPGSRLAAPQHHFRLWIEGVPGVTAGADTLLRGGPAVLRGQLLDEDGAPALSFEGEADVLVRDSDIYRLTPPDPYTNTFDYYLPGTRIFSGRATVSGGEFACPFFVPTALRVGSRGPARAYAYLRSAAAGVPAGLGGEDGAGALGQLFIPESRLPSGDTLGPAIGLSWENPDELQPGSRLWATLEDSSGIYVAALAPSRSVVLTIADRDNRILVAEDLAEEVAFGEDFRVGWLRYEIPEGLVRGEQLVLALEASDNVGRRSREELGFHLGAAGDSLGRLLGMAYNVPNPMEAETRFFFELEREAELTVVVYAASGRKILTLPGGWFSPARARDIGIPWDGRDEDGDRIANGLYFYRVLARGNEGRSEERIERLVVLR
ncbi:MAG: C25 family cysteine peptidase [Candidatus Eisenbacteria bacterium]